MACRRSGVNETLVEIPDETGDGVRGLGRQSRIGHQVLSDRLGGALGLLAGREELFWRNA